jgi:hypothetical protein
MAPPCWSKYGANAARSLSPNQSAARHEIRTFGGATSKSFATSASTVSRSPRPVRFSSRPSINNTWPRNIAGGVLRKARAVMKRARSLAAVSRNRCVFPVPGSPSRTIFAFSENFAKGRGVAPSRRSAAMLICRTARAITTRRNQVGCSACLMSRKSFLRCACLGRRDESERPEGVSVGIGVGSGGA